MTTQLKRLLTLGVLVAASLLGQGRVNPRDLRQAGATSGQCLVWNGTIWAPDACAQGGSGITSLNGQTAATQTFATGTTGSDFGISSSGGVHTFNLPTASASNRGLLSTSDWSTFNSKQAAGSYITALTGDVTATGPGSVAATLANIPSATPMAGSLLATNIAAPSTPAAGKTSIYVDSTTKVPTAKNDAGTISNMVVADTGAANNFLTAISAGGVISKSQPSCSSLSDAAASCATDATNASNISSGTLGGARLPAFAGGDVTSSAGSVVLTLGNIPTGVTAAGYLAFTNIAAPSTPAAGITRLYVDSTSKVPAAKNDAGTVSTMVVPDTGASNNFLTAISSAGVISKAQPACSSLSNAAASCSTDATNASNISSGTLAAGRLPAFSGGDVTSSAGSAVLTLGNIPTATTAAGYVAFTAIAVPGTPGAGVGRVYVDSTSKNIAVKDDAGVVKHGVQTDTGTANNYISAISDSGAITKSRPTCSTLSDAAASCATDATNASNISSGTLPNARLSAVPNSALANASTTVNSQTCTLGSTCTVTAHAMFFGSGGSFNPADGTTYYLGGFPTAAMTATAAIRKIPILRSGTITECGIFFLNGTAGTAETSTVSFRLNNTTDTTISSSVVNNATMTGVFSNTSMSVSVSAGDYFEIKWVAPTWATEPLTVGASGHCIQR